MWGSCNVGCGGGVQARGVRCMGPRKGFEKHFCKLFLQNNDEKQQNHCFQCFFHYFDDFLITQFLRKNQLTKIST